MPEGKAAGTPVEGKADLSRFLMSAPVGIPDDVKERLTSLALDEPSPVRTTVEAAELIYARADELPVELIELGAQLATVAANFDFHGMRSDNNRGYAIAQTLRKKPGVVAAPVPVDLPAPVPSSRHMPEAAPSEAPVAPPVAGQGERP